MNSPSTVTKPESRQTLFGTDTDIGIATPRMERNGDARRALATAVSASNRIDPGPQPDVKNGRVKFMPWIAIVPSLLAVLAGFGMYVIVHIVIAHVSA